MSSRKIRLCPSLFLGTEFGLWISADAANTGREIPWPWYRQVARSSEIQRPNSVPRKSRLGIAVSSLMTLRVAAHTAVGGHDRRPSLPIVRGLEDVRIHVSKCVAVKRCISRARIIEAGFHPRNPRSFRQIGNIANNVGPGFGARRVSPGDSRHRFQSRWSWPFAR